MRFRKWPPLRSFPVFPPWPSGYRLKGWDWRFFLLAKILIFKLSIPAQGVFISVTGKRKISTGFA
jgi:hypothetical protein